MDRTYIGNELDLFALADCWKAYLGRKIPHPGARVLEVGAGMGTTTAILCDGSSREWVCLEPDSKLLSRLEERIRLGNLPACCHPFHGVISELPRDEKFDCILYVDVLEHIQADKEELEFAARRLEPSGRLIVLAPAHPFIFSDFDRAIGHFRRYTRRSLAALQPQGCRLIKCYHLDSLGLLTSLANRMLLKQSMPTREQILFWDRWLIPLTRVMDPLVGYSFGRVILGIWQKVPAEKR
jgi:SAM-dependent methyltransferase